MVRVKYNLSLPFFLFTKIERRKLMSNYTTTNRAFRPVKCNEADLQGRTAIDGYVYFAMDSKKIFCASEGDYIPMGGNSGVYYGNRTFAEDETNTGETDFVFNADLDIEGD
jgi:hypothetical protein